MPTAQTAPVTQLLARWERGERECLEQLLPLIHDELRRIARRYMRMESPGHTLQTTALVNEAYLRLVDQTRATWQNRAQFFSIAARVMRRILVNHARRSHRQKRGGDVCLLPLNEDLAFCPAKSSMLIALDDALGELAKFDPRKAQVVELRYFGGMSVEETAEALGIHANTVIRDWDVARRWLRGEMARTS